MTYDTSEGLMNSQVAYRILRALQESENEEGMYAKQIAEELDTSRNSVANYIKILRDQNLIKRTKRTRAQYYDINHDGLIDFFQENWSEIIEKSDADLSDLFPFDEYCETLVEKTSKLKSNEFEYPVYLPKDLLKNYFRFYLHDNVKSTIGDMVVHDFISDLGVNVPNSEDEAELHVAFQEGESFEDIDLHVAIKGLYSSQWYKLHYQYTSVYRMNNREMDDAGNWFMRKRKGEVSGDGLGEVDFFDSNEEEETN